MVWLHFGHSVGGLQVVVIASNFSHCRAVRLEVQKLELQDLSFILQTAAPPLSWKFIEKS